MKSAEDWFMLILSKVPPPGPGKSCGCGGMPAICPPYRAAFSFASFAHTFSESASSQLFKNGSRPGTRSDDVPIGPSFLSDAKAISSDICATLSANWVAGFEFITHAPPKRPAVDKELTSRHRIVACGIPNALTGSAGMTAFSMYSFGSSCLLSSSSTRDAPF